MVFNVIVYGFVALIVGAFAWLIIKPKKSCSTDDAKHANRATATDAADRPVREAAG